MVHQPPDPSMAATSLINSTAAYVPTWLLRRMESRTFGSRRHLTAASALPRKNDADHLRLPRLQPNPQLFTLNTDGGSLRRLRRTRARRLTARPHGSAGVDRETCSPFDKICLHLSRPRRCLLPFPFFHKGVVSISLPGECGPIPGHRHKNGGARVGDFGVFSERYALL